MNVLLRRAIFVAVLLVATSVALAAGAGVLYYLPAWTARIGWIVVAGLATVAAASWAGAWLSAGIVHIGPRRLFASGVSALIAIASAAALYIAVLRPSGAPHADVVPRANTRYWDLPTGSHIAYSEYDPPTGVTVRPEPVIILHGGAGFGAFDFDHDFYRKSAAYGFRVYIYDEAGVGLSGKLPRARDYTLERAIADLEAIRQQIGSPKIILIGHSWGGMLAANYMAKYPERVAKVVFHSPGSIWNADAMEWDYSRTAASPQLPPENYRLNAAWLLQERNPDAAENLLPQGESGDMFRRLVDFGSFVCKGDTADPPLSALPPGENLYLQRMMEDMNGSAGDPHRILAENHTPAMLAYSECDYLSWNNRSIFAKHFRT